MRHTAAQVLVDPIREVLIPDPRHPIANHLHAHTRAKLDPEVDAVEECECRAERVADHCDRRHAVLCECLLDVGEDRGRGAANVFDGMRSNAKSGWRVTYLACSEAKPLCTSTEDEIPGKRDESSDLRKKSTSVRSAKLKRGMSDGRVRMCLSKFSSQFTGVGTLVGDNDGFLRRGEPDIPCAEAT